MNLVSVYKYIFYILYCTLFIFCLNETDEFYYTMFIFRYVVLFIPILNIFFWYQTNVKILSIELSLRNNKSILFNGICPKIDYENCKFTEIPHIFSSHS